MPPSNPDSTYYDKISLERDNRALRDRLEHSQLKLSLKESECQELSKLVAELRSQIPSTRFVNSVVYELDIPSNFIHSPYSFSDSSNRSPLPTLPSEILQVVFGYATEFAGLVYYPWKYYRSPNEWEISSITRRSIPLVCRQWHANGLQFLYHHIKLETYSQAQKLRHTLDSISQEERVARLSWIRGLELLLGPSPAHLIDSYWELASELILDIPVGNLKTFSIESLHESDFSKCVDALHRVREHVEVLQLGYSEYCINFTDLLRLFSPNETVMEQATVNFPKLRTLFFNTEKRRAPEVSTSDILSLLKNNLHQLQSVALSWPREISSVQRCLGLLARARHITTLYISSSTFGDLLYRDFEELLTALPNLKHLTFGILFLPDSRLPQEFMPGILHSKLEIITISLEAPATYETIRVWGPLLAKIRQDELPHLSTIFIKGPYLSGCIDSSWTVARHLRERWSAAIKLCDEKGVRLLTLENEPIYLWNERHAIDKKLAFRRRKRRQRSQDEKSRDEDQAEGHEDDSESEDLITDTSDDSQWYRLETDDGSFNSDSNNEIDDDSEDEPYRYVAQADIELVDSDSDDSDIPV
jgi:hypothetical protein